VVIFLSGSSTTVGLLVGDVGALLDGDSVASAPSDDAFSESLSS
jgi:hypothetical protein